MKNPESIYFNLLEHPVHLVALALLAFAAAVGFVEGLFLIFRWLGI